MRKIKKFLLVIMAVVVLGTLVSCGKEEEPEFTKTLLYVFDSVSVTDKATGVEKVYKIGDVLTFTEVVDGKEVSTEVHLTKDSFKFQHQADNSTLTCELFITVDPITQRPSAGRVRGRAYFTGNEFIYNVNFEDISKINFKNGIKNLEFITGYVTYEEKVVANKVNKITTILMTVENEKYVYNWVVSNTTIQK